MLGINAILVPVDFSDPSKEALKYGMSLAVELNATLIVTHVVQYSVPAAYAFPIETHQIQRNQVGQIEQQLKDLIPVDFRQSLNCRFIAKAGVIEDELLGIIEEEPVDLVVMGTHGRRRFERWILGSATEHILRKVHVPILTVSHLDEGYEIGELRPVPLHKLLYATDIAANSSDTMRLALDLASEFSAELIVLHVMQELRWAYGTEYVPLDIENDTVKLRENIEARLEGSLPESVRHDPRIRTELVEGVPCETILSVAEEENVDMIVLNLQSKSGLERALIGATAERVVRSAHTPVLSVPALKSVTPIAQRAADEFRTESFLGAGQ
jgi:nucleotide-binding universal stress UspA family protein